LELEHEDNSCLLPIIQAGQDIACNISKLPGLETPACCCKDKEKEKYETGVDYTTQGLH